MKKKMNKLINTEVKGTKRKRVEKRDKLRKERRECRSII
jgi:hypothetical protein